MSKPNNNLRKGNKNPSKDKQRNSGRKPNSHNNRGNNRRNNDSQAERNFDKPEGQNRQNGGKSLPGNNDVAWYTLDPTILKDAASYPFSNPVGSAYQNASLMCGAPGIMVIEYEPNYGESDSASSPINLAAMKFYAFVRQANSGSKNYESSDLMMYFMAVTNLYSALAHFRRCYGLLGTYSNYNKYLGKTLINALGMDYTVMRANQADLRRQFNTLVDQINMALHIPVGLKVSERHVFCNSGVFVDSPGRKFQIYVLKQKHYFQFDAATYSSGSALIGTYPETNGETLYNVRTVDPYDYLDWVEGLVSNLVGNEDINIMSGDILKAYGESGCYKLGYLEEDYTTPFLNDVMMLSQIHNIQSNYNPTAPMVWRTGIPKTGESTKEAYNTIPTVVQSNNVIINKPYVGSKDDLGNTTALRIDLLLDIPVESPTPADVMESTRLMTMADPNDTMNGPNGEGDTPIIMWGIIAGSEIVTSLKVVTTFFNGTNKTYEPAWWNSATVNICDKNDVHSYTDYVTDYVRAFSAFNWHPLLVITNSTGANVDSYIGDISNFTILTKINIDSLHSAAIYGEFDVPVKSV